MKRFQAGNTGFVFVVISACLVIALLFFLNFFLPFHSTGEWKEVRIPRGTSYTHGIAILKREGIVSNDFLLHMIGKLTRMDTEMKPGYYNLNTAMSLWNILRHLTKGFIVQYRITIPEGSDLGSIKEKLVTAGLVSEASWKAVYDGEFLASLGIDAPSLEGYLYPDTYRFAKGLSPQEIFSMMVQRMRTQFDERLRKRAEEIGMSEREVLTLASIIEKEALYNKERPIISAVYHNRLKKDMKLQADPTVNYGVKASSSPITRSDLKRVTPYNTYVIDDLPPGPIASPGINSIRAALYPADSDYLYFVSRNDGTHHFSLTGIEHMKAVMMYQRGDGS